MTVLKAIVKAAQPRRLIYIALDGEDPCAKIDESRRRIFDRIHHNRDQAPSFLWNLPGSPFDATPIWQAKMCEFMQTLEHWSSAEVIFDSSFVLGEAEIKFATWYRSSIKAGTLPRGLRYTIFSGDSDVINLALLFHEPDMTIIRGKNEGQTELVQIARLRTAMANCYGDSARRIDDAVAISFFIGNDFLPGVASFSQLEQAYKRLPGFLVENGSFVPGSLRELFQSVLSFVQGERGSLSRDPELAKRYLRTAAWLLKYYCCGCASWRWTYGSTRIPSLQTLIAVADDFDPVFEYEPPISRLANLLIKNAPRSRPDLPKVCQTMLAHPAIGKFFKSSTFEPVDVDLYMRIYDEDIAPAIEDPYPLMNKEHQRLLLRRGKDPEEVLVGELSDYVSTNDTIVGGFRVGERVIFERKMAATVLRVLPDGRLELDLEKVQVPDCSAIFARSQDWQDIRSLFGALQIRSAFFRVMNKILGNLQISGDNFGLRCTRTYREQQVTVVDGTQKVETVAIRLGRLGLVQVLPKDDGYADLLVSPRVAAAVCEYCRRARQVPQQLARSKNLTIESVWHGDRRKADEFKAWITKEFPDEVFPYVQVTRSERQCAALAGKLAGAPIIGFRRCVPATGIIRKDHCQIGNAEFDWNQPVISIAPDESFGCVGFIVGYSRVTGLAAVILAREKHEFTTLGNLIPSRTGIVTDLGSLLQL
jgi:hypothetical protein